MHPQSNVWVGPSKRKHGFNASRRGQRRDRSCIQYVLLNAIREAMQPVVVSPMDAHNVFWDARRFKQFAHSVKLFALPRAQAEHVLLQIELCGALQARRNADVVVIAGHCGYKSHRCSANMWHMLLEKTETCIRSSVLLEKDILLAVAIFAAATLQVIWTLLDARPRKTSSGKSHRDASF